MPYPNPATVVRCFDMASAAAWFDGKDVFLDERCAWCHANRMLLAGGTKDQPLLLYVLLWTDCIYQHVLIVKAFTIMC